MKKIFLVSACILCCKLVHADEKKGFLLNQYFPKRTYIPKPFFSAPTTDKVFVDFVGNGDIQKSLTESKSISANTGLGIIFERYRGVDKSIQSFEFDLIINVASTSDSIIAKLDSSDAVTNIRDFGTYMINPLSSKQATTINAKLYFGNYDKHPLFRYLSGLQLKFCASNSLWVLNGVSKNVTGMLLRVGGFHELIPDNKRIDENGRSLYSVIVGFNYSMRTILSDLSSNQNKEFRQKILNGSSGIVFNGIEINFGVKLRNLCAEVQIPILNNGGINNIDGLTNTQLITGIRFVGGFPLQINLKKETPRNDDAPTPIESNN